jgi:hypothetical protein
MAATAPRTRRQIAEEVARTATATVLQARAAGDARWVGLKEVRTAAAELGYDDTAYTLSTIKAAVRRVLAETENDLLAGIEFA